MAARIELRIGIVKEIGGIPYTLVATRENLAILSVGTIDADGFVEEPADVKTAANRWRREFDKTDD